MKMLKITILSLLMTAATAKGQESSQQPFPPPGHGAPQPPPQRPPFDGALFPPEAILSNQERLGVTEDQKKKIIAEMDKVKSEIDGFQKEIENEKKEFDKILQKTPINEAAALSQEEKLFAVEKKIKALHLKLLIRIKNVLTAEQINKLKR